MELQALAADQKQEAETALHEAEKLKALALTLTQDANLTMVRAEELQQAAAKSQTELDQKLAEVDQEKSRLSELDKELHELTLEQDGTASKQQTTQENLDIQKAALQEKTEEVSQNLLVVAEKERTLETRSSEV